MTVMKNVAIFFVLLAVSIFVFNLDVDGTISAFIAEHSKVEIMKLKLLVVLLVIWAGVTAVWCWKGQLKEERLRLRPLYILACGLCAVVAALVFLL